MINPPGEPGKDVQSVFDVIRLALSKDKNKKVDPKQTDPKHPEDNEEEEKMHW